MVRVRMTLILCLANFMHFMQDLWIAPPHQEQDHLENQSQVENLNWNEKFYKKKERKRMKGFYIKDCQVANLLVVVDLER